MATKKTKQAAVEPQLTRKERQAMRKDLEQLSQFSTKELVEILKKDPDSQLATNVLLDSLWPKFKQTFDIAMPQKGRMSDQQYQKMLDNYRRWTKSIKGIALYWYAAGMNHRRNYESLLDILDESKDAQAPEQNTVEADNGQQ